MESPTQDPTLTPEQIPPTNSQPVPPTEDPRDRQIRIFEELTRSQNARITELEQSQAANRAAPPPEEKITPEQFFADPVHYMDDRLEKKLKETVAPLLDFVEQFRGGTQTDKFINQFKNDSRFSSQWDDSLERYIREQAVTIPPKQLTEQNFGLIVLTGIGARAAGLIPGARTPTPQTPTPTPMPQNQNRDIIPPYIAPSNLPAAPNGGNDKKLRPLSEHEERLRRERKLTHEQFLSWLEVPASQVAISDVGRTK